MVIEIEGNDNVSGVRYLLFNDAHNVNNVPEPVNGYVAGTMEAKDINLQHTVKFTLGTGEFTEEQKAVDGDEQYDSELKFLIPKDRPDMLGFFESLRGRRFVVLFVDNNEYWHLMGTPEKPCKLEVEKRGSGGDWNGHEVRFTMSNNLPVPFCDAP
jgi:hypothetical protein